MKYSIEGGSIVLNDITNKITCPKCANTLILVNDGILFIKSSATIFDTDNNKITLKCTKCKNFNTRNLIDINNKEVKTLIEI